ncbi:DedA family protein [Paraclostridium sordellii]|uniref:DedA family protein n=1 Tax=Paraclostridium sordellii TaxID=1505 RepID=A0A0C7R8L8_PARSO|nr:DedA family protein [Paeniclostridium sordellii]QYE97155.1 DedA family protein [Paeniclostridium sordellii]CEN21366.1 DedA family protein [[Clostridium] sordellii] [Paeniclostridium sordellii]CEN79166.1 DedA family protein [[Clostridium] sordellii] [Paeniclostridium sordellii]CEP88394.1 DedA family protein [[Clostridium] sordellii] [Paeniclostridium sordellii]CEP97002.1 DedA family protein [[Clostridium] sordellii] [Paeniclostridium sordellii]
MDLKLLIEQFMINYGLISIFLVVALEYANFPLPSELVLPLVGIFAFEYDMNLIQVLFASISGGVIGSIINYYLGFKFGKPFIDMIGKKFPSTKKSIKSSYRWISKYDKVSTMLSRLVPVARTFISIVAGVIKMNLVAFIVYSTIGIGIWNTILIYAGYLLGDKLHLITYILKQYSLIVIVIGILAFITYILINRFKIKK